MRTSRTALVVACLALFAALGGTATAAKLITSTQIKNNTITGKDVRNRSLTRSDLGFSTATRFTIVDGPELTVQPGGSSDGDFEANCPSGTTAIGTGFNASITDVGFVKSYDFFVGGFFFNNSSIPVEVSVQAICAGGNGAVAVSAGDRAKALRAYKSDVANAKGTR